VIKRLSENHKETRTDAGGRDDGSAHKHIAEGTAASLPPGAPGQVNLQMPCLPCLSQTR